MIFKCMINVFKVNFVLGHITCNTDKKKSFLDKHKSIYLTVTVKPTHLWPVAQSE